MPGVVILTLLPVASACVTANAATLNSHMSAEARTAYVRRRVCQSGEVVPEDALKQLLSYEQRLAWGAAQSAIRGACARTTMGLSPNAAASPYRQETISEDEARLLLRLHGLATASVYTKGGEGADNPAVAVTRVDRESMATLQRVICSDTAHVYLHVYYVPKSKPGEAYFSDGYVFAAGTVADHEIRWWSETSDDGDVSMPAMQTPFPVLLVGFVGQTRYEFDPPLIVDHDELTQVRRSAPCVLSRQAEPRN